MDKWEYKEIVFSGNHMRELEKAGRERWELIAVTTANDDNFATGYLKRRIVNRDYRLRTAKDIDNA